MRHAVRSPGSPARTQTPARGAKVARLGVNRARAALAVAGSAALVAASGGIATAATGGAPAAPACTDTWVGQSLQGQWTDATNWSTGQVPGPASDVCITRLSVLTVHTAVSVKVHSLRIGGLDSLNVDGTASHRLTVTAATSVTIVPTTNNVRSINLTDATISTPRINDQGGFITTTGNCHLNSPDILLARAFATPGSLFAANGTTTLSSLSQLSNGTLSGAGVFAANGATVVLPGDISRLASAIVEVDATSAIEDPARHNALTGLTSVDSGSVLEDGSSLKLTASSLTDAGEVDLTGGATTINGPITLQAPTGSLLLSGNMTLKASQVMIPSGTGLTAEGPASITGNVVNDGAVQVDPGTLGVTGNYTQAAGASLTSGFLALLKVTGTASLAGTLISGEVFPKPGDTSAVLSYGSLSGGFTSLVLGITMTVKPHEIDATIVPQIRSTVATVAPGQTVLVRGRSFVYRERVKVFLDSTGGTPLVTGRQPARTEGIIPLDVPIPASATAGVHKLIAVGSDGSRATTTIKVS